MKKRPDQWILYGIFDLGYAKEAELETTCEAMCAGGVDVIQLRAKKYSLKTLRPIAARLRVVTREFGVGCVINDDPHLAAECEADAVHIGQEDGSIAKARHLSDGCLVGRSTHSLEQAIQAEAEGADYIGFGPLFATPTKPEYAPIGTSSLAEVHRLLKLPIFCIGGIKLGNLPEVVAAGARRVVIVSGLLQAADCRSYAEQASQILSGTGMEARR